MSAPAHKNKKAAAQAKTQKKAGPTKKKQSGPQLTNTARALPDRHYAVGDKASNKMASASSNLVAESQMTSMTGTISEVQVADLLANSRIYAIARTIVHKVCSILSTECDSAVSSTQWSPVSLCSYLVWALFDSLRASGAFQLPAMINAFPPFPRDLNIPVAWAEALKYLKPFRSGTASSMFVDNTLSALPTLPGSQIIVPGATSFANDSWCTRSGPHAAASNVESPVTAGAAPTYAQVYAAAPFLSNVFSRALACVTYAEVPTSAPDASAYAVPSVGDGFACWTPHFNPEVAFVLGVSGLAGQAYASLNAYMKPAPVFLGYHPPEFWWVENFQMCTFLPNGNLDKTLKTHAWNQAEFADKKSPHGRIRYHRSAAAKGHNQQPVRFLLGNSTPLDTRTYQALAAAFLAANFPNGASSLYTPQRLFSYAAVVLSALIAKVMPYSYCSMAATGTVLIDTAYDPQFMDVPLPASIAAVLNSIGPIAVDGRLIYPQIAVNGSSAVAGAWVTLGTLGLSAATNALVASFYGGTNATGPTVGGFLFDAVTYPTTTTLPSTPVNSSQVLINDYNAIFNTASVAGAVPSVMIKPDSHNPVGKANQLVMADVTVVTNNGVVLSSGGQTTKGIIISSVGSYKCLAGDELGLALSCPVVYPVNQARNISTISALNPPFRAQIGSNAGKQAALIELATSCNTGAMQDALGTALATIQRQTKEIGGVTVDVSSNGDLFGAILDKLVGPVFGDKVATGIKNSPVGKIASHAVPLLAGGPGLWAADRLGVTDGVLSSFGLGKPIAGRKGTMKGKMAGGMINGAAQLLGAL